MNDTVWIMTASAVTALAAYALCVRFGVVWGIDPSRRTPAEETGKVRSSVGLLMRLLLVLAAPVLLAAHGAELDLSLLFCCAFALAGGTAAYAAAFVCVRCGGAGMAKTAREEIGPAGRSVDLLAFLSCTALGALMLRECAAYFGWAVPMQNGLRTCAALLPAAAGLCVRLCEGFAAHVGGEDEAAPLCMGGAGIAALVCAALCAALNTGIAAALAPCALWLHGVFAALCAVTALCCAHTGSAALKGLFARERLFAPKRSMPFALYLCAALAAQAGLVFAPVSALPEIAGTLGGAYVLVVLVLCRIWLRRVGRGLLF